MNTSVRDRVATRNGKHDAAPPAPPKIRCPACGASNAGDAVFCSNERCRKALGPFPYVGEELEARSRWHERLADRVAAFIGRPHFLAAHALWVAAWLCVNTGVLALVSKFDEYPYSLLGLVISVEAIFITGFVLISQNRQTAHAEKRGELDYEVNVRTYREIGEVKIYYRSCANGWIAWRRRRRERAPARPITACECALTRLTSRLHLSRRR